MGTGCSNPAIQEEDPKTGATTIVLVAERQERYPVGTRVRSLLEIFRGAELWDWDRARPVADPDDRLRQDTTYYILLPCEHFPALACVRACLGM